jgi:Flp pilus assembly protein TadD
MTSATQRRLRFANGYAELGMIDAALGELRAISVLDRGTLPVLTARIEVLLAGSRWEDVYLAAQPLTLTHPEVERGWTAAAYALRELGRIDDARRMLEAALHRHGHGTGLVHYNLACYYALLDQLAAAREHLRLAFARDAALRTDAPKDRDLEALHSELESL